MKRVLIISPLDDIHSFAVSKKIGQLGLEALIIDSSEFPGAWELITKMGGRDNTCFLRRTDGSICIDFADVVGAWWRRPKTSDLSELVSHPSYRQFASAECEQAFTGSFVALIPNFINPIQSSRMASRKLVQLAVASRFGLRTPATLVTTDPHSAELFYKELNGECIYKTFTGCDFGFFETRLLTPADLDELWRLRTCPTIFQEHIRGDFDLRITIVDRAVFAAKLLFKQGGHPVDGRVGNVPIEPTELPGDISEKLLKLMDHFGLRYAAIDMRYSTSEGYTFFEINPEGQFLWIEIEAGLEISNAIALALAKV